MTTIAICPGFHSSRLTTSFLANARLPPSADVLVFPIEKHPPHAASEIARFLENQIGEPAIAPSLALIAFSAGVAGAIGAAWAWRARGGRVSALFALDGWGVPLAGDFPIYRVSHDAFTDWSSAWLGGGEERFYCEPPVPHLDLWRAPHLARGWRRSLPGCRARGTAAEFIEELARARLAEG